MNPNSCAACDEVRRRNEERAYLRAKAEGLEQAAQMVVKQTSMNNEDLQKLFLSAANELRQAAQR